MNSTLINRSKFKSSHHLIGLTDNIASELWILSKTLLQQVTLRYAHFHQLCFILCTIQLTIGSAAVVTVTFIHPIDVVKTRLQVGGQYKALGVGGTIKLVLKEEGVSSFWKGIGAAWMREASYTSLRLGLYDPIKKVMGVTPDSNFFWKFLAGSLAGGIGSCVGNPFDVLKTRMMATEGTTIPKMSVVAKDLHAQQGLGKLFHAVILDVVSLYSVYNKYHSVFCEYRWVLSWIGGKYYACYGAKRYKNGLL